nr:uncharacterized protein LOC100184881 [Ciona intestinalis]|eukprot:XP_018670496.1 uncharacterized protein LOC100184881 [Ciona intestinalis]
MPLHIPISNKSRNISSATLKSSSSTSNISSLSVNKSSAFLGPAQWRVTDEDHSGKLLAGIRWLQKMGTMSDITFTYQDKTIKANRVVLAAVSPVMRDVFVKKENLMNAEVIPPEALRELVHFVYSGSTEVTYDVIKKIHSASRVLQVPSLLRMTTKLLDQIPHCTAKVPTNPPKTTNRPRLSRMANFDDESFDEPQQQSEAPPFKLGESPTEDRTNEDVANELKIDSELSKRNSIRLTFHSRSGTPLNQSVEDLRRLSDASSTGSVKKLDDPPRKETRAPSLPEVRIHKADDLGEHGRTKGKEMKLLNGEKLTPKRLRQISSRSFDDDLMARPRSSSDQLQRYPILLSAFIDVPPSLPRIFPLQKLINSEGGNGTWPRVLKTSPQRPCTPDRWKLTNSNESIISKSSATDKSSNSTIKSRQNSLRTRICKDVLTIRFYSKTVPELLKGLNSLREQGRFCDLILTVGNSKIRCHRVIMAASSPIFRAILDRFSSSEIALTKVDDVAMLELVRFIYTGQCSIDRDNVVSVLRASRRFKIPFVAEQCTNYLDRHCGGFNNFFSPANVLVAYKMAATYGCPKLREESRKFAISHFWEVAETKAFRELTSLELNRLISSESLKTARSRDPDLEHLFYNAILNWLVHAPTSRIPIMTSRVMKFVQFSNLKIGVLNNLVSKEMAIVLEKSIRDRVEEAIRTKSNLLPRRSSSMKQLSSFKVYVDHPPAPESKMRCLITREEEKRMKTWICSPDPNESRWETMTSSPLTGRGYAVTSYGGALYVAGGSDAIKNIRTCADVYKYEDSKWSFVADMRLRRSHFSLIQLEGVLYAVGGLNETFDKGSVECCPTSSIEMLDLNPDNGPRNWKLVASLISPSYYHAATSCVMTSSRRVTSSLSDLDKSETSKTKPPASPNRKKTFGHRLTSAITAGFEEAKHKTQRNKSPRHNTVNAKKVNQEKDISKSSPAPTKVTTSRKVIVVCGGKTNPMQCVMFDVEKNKCSSGSLLPVQCTNPVMTSYKSRVFVVCNDVTQMTSSGFRCFENDLNYDRWTELSKPLCLDQTKFIKLNNLPAEKIPLFQSKMTLSCTIEHNCVSVTSVKGDVTTTYQYDMTSSRWKSSAKSINFRKNIEFPIKDFHTLFTSS